LSQSKLTPFEEWVIRSKGTEKPFTGQFTDHFEAGTYLCRACGAPLYRSADKFHSSCGWPSFDDEIKGAVKKNPDADGRRTEIVCAKCDGHLGHVFEGEGFTSKNLRHCVNSVSMKFQPQKKESERKSYFASGCFWGTEYYFAREPGMIATRVGFMGGHKDHPTYKEVCAGTTGHLECVEATWDPERTTYEKVVKLFFETHDFSQEDGQGPDVGPQYLSAIFYANEEEKKTAEKVIAELKHRDLKVATALRPVSTFWSAEEYHQEYYLRQGKEPYCHFKRQIF